MTSKSLVDKNSFFYLLLHSFFFFLLLNVLWFSFPFSFFGSFILWECNKKGTSVGRYESQEYKP